MESSSGDKNVTASQANVLGDIKTYAKDAKNTDPTENFSRFMRFYKPEMKPPNNAAKRHDLPRALENKLPTSDVQQINNDVNRYHAQAEQYYRRQLEEALKQSPVDKLISSLKQQQKK